MSNSFRRENNQEIYTVRMRTRERFWVEKIQSEAEILTKIYSQEQGNQPCLAITQEQYEEC
jgi:hypothetical protein